MRLPPPPAYRSPPPRGRRRGSPPARPPVPGRSVAPAGLRRPTRESPRLILLLLGGLLAACAAPGPVTGTPPAGPPTPAPARSLTPAPAGSWQIYRLEDGLPYPSTTSLAADGRGGIWVGTPQGAAHFDGTAWIAYSVQDGLLSNVVLDLAVDHDGVVWFGGDRGLTRFDGLHWTHYTDADPLPSGYVNEVAVDRTRQVWLGIAGVGADWAFGNGVARLDDGRTPFKGDDRWQVFPPTRERMAGDVVSAIADLGPAGVWFGVTPEGTVRAGSGRGGVWRLLGLGASGPEGTVWTAARADDGLPGDTVSALAPDPRGGLWLGTTHGLMYLEPAAVAGFDFTGAARYTASQGLPSDRVLSLAADGSGAVWVGTDAGLARVQAGRIETFSTADGLPDNQIRDVAVTPEGEVWVATPSGVAVLRR